MSKLKVKVENMQSSRGNDVPNQFIITTDKGTYLQSYNSIIAFVPNDSTKKTRLGPNWSYSVTTGKYRNQFLGETKAETQAKLDSKEYILDKNL